MGPPRAFLGACVLGHSTPCCHTVLIFSCALSNPWNQHLTKPNYSTSSAFVYHFDVLGCVSHKRVGAVMYGWCEGTKVAVNHGQALANWPKKGHGSK